MAPPKPPVLNTADFLVVFGPRNTYLARAPHISRSNLITSPSLSTIIDDAKTVNSVVFPVVEEPSADGEEYSVPDPYLAYVKKGLLGDSKIYSPSEAYYPELKEWLDRRWGTGGLQVIGNGKGGWWGLSNSGNTKWVGMPGDVRQLLKPGNPHGKVVHMALGVKNSYITAFEDGHVDWDLKGCYDRLDEQLEARASGELVYVSLSVYEEDQFFCVFKDATIIYDFPKGSDELNEDFLDVEGLRVMVQSDTAKHTGDNAATATKAAKPGMLRSFSEDVLKSVAESEAESEIGKALGS